MTETKNCFTFVTTFLRHDQEKKHYFSFQLYVRYAIVTGKRNLIFFKREAATGGVLCKKLFLEISQNSQENTCARDSFLIKLQGSGLQLY